MASLVISASEGFFPSGDVVLHEHSDDGLQLLDTSLKCTVRCNDFRLPATETAPPTETNKFSGCNIDVFASDFL